MGHVLGMGNMVGVSGNDPIHLNDVEPVLTDGPYWQKGDVFLSLRHRSAIMLYRPATNELLQYLQGPFLNQHDIDILSPNTISIFNNNAPTVGNFFTTKKALDIGRSIGHSNITVYNFTDSSYTYPMKKVLDREAFYTESNGLHTFLTNGDLFLESHNNGKIYVVNQNETKLRQYANTPKDGKVEQPHWIRVYENVDF